MQEYRFVGVGVGGQSVTGTIHASNKNAAEKKVEELSDKHRFVPQEVQQRVVFRYKVKHPEGETLTGEQKAFTKEEVTRALENMGMTVVSVQKKLINLQMKPPATDIVLFVRQAANLLEENLPFDEILELLVEDATNSVLKQTIRDLHRDLKHGVESQQAFMKHQDTLGTFTAYMLGIASKSGNMAEIFQATAKYLERRDEFKKSIRSSMITPAITVIATIGALIWYIWYIIPETVGLFANLDVTIPPMTSAALAMAEWLDANYGWVLLGIVLVTGAITAFVRSKRGTFLIHRYMIRLPVIGKLLHKLNIEIFCRVFSVLYSGSGDNIRVIKIAAEATGNAYIAQQIKTVTIPKMLAEGAGLVTAMKASKVFTKMAISRFKSGSETGNIRESARQMAEYYAKETDMKMDMVLQGIQTAVSVFITLAILGLTLLSAEMAQIQPSASGMMGM